MKIFNLLSIFLLLLFSSCVKNSEEYKRLLVEKDSLLQVQSSMKSEVEGYLAAMNTIEQNIQQIKEAQNAVAVNSGKDVSPDQQTRINEDIAFMGEMLKANQAELEKLKSKLKKSAFKSAQLEATIDKLTKSLEEESLKVAALEAKILHKDSIINDLDSKVTALNQDIKGVNEEVKRKEELLKQQEEALNTAWYVFGTKKELKQQRIITSDGLFSSTKVLQGDFNKSYFVRIDSRKTKSIPLYSSRAKILTSHPKNSYTLEKENASFVLLITDSNLFWSTSKYLVIEVE